MAPAGAKSATDSRPPFLGADDSQPRGISLHHRVVSNFSSPTVLPPWLPSAAVPFPCSTPASR
jgi:hypothetical protein